MKNRRDFLKTLLGVALVAPVACRTVVPEPFDLPARHDFDAYDPRKRMIVDFKVYRTQLEQDVIQEREAKARIDTYRRRYPDFIQAFEDTAEFPNHPVRRFAARYWK